MVEILGSPKMKGIGIRRATPIRIPKPPGPTNHRVATEKIQKTGFFSFGGVSTWQWQAVMFEFQPFLKRLKKTAFVVRLEGGEGEGWMRLIQVIQVQTLGGGNHQGKQNYHVFFYFEIKSCTLPETNIARTKRMFGRLSTSPLGPWGWFSGSGFWKLKHMISTGNWGYFAYKTLPC